MLLWWDGYPLRRWQLNLLYFQVPQKERDAKPPVLMTARLDGPSPELAMRLVDRAIEVEQKGLAGKVYVDARGIKWDPKTDPGGTGYGGYDESLREMARLLDKDAKLPVTLDDKQALFAPNSCLDCALYCGWYSLGNYVDCCRFVPGAVAYHIASSEAVTLRNPQTKQWCKNLLDNGVIATLGPVAEPYNHRLSQACRVFRLPRHRQIHPRGVLQSHTAAYELDDRAGRRSPLQSLRENAPAAARAGHAESRGQSSVQERMTHP